MNLTSSCATIKLLLATVALTLGANTQNAKLDYDWAWHHPEQYTNAFNACIEQALAQPKLEDSVNDQFPCYQLETAMQDRRLNINYKLTMASKKPADQTGLRLYERAWIELRDNSCGAYEKNTRPGLAHLITVLFARDCTLQWTKERADQLERK